MDEAELKQKFEQANKIKEVLGTYFEKEELEIGMVVGVLMSMLVNVMKDADTPPHHAILMFGTAVAKCYDDDDDEDESNKEGVAQWLN
jgi:hypothetical protein